MNLLLSLVTLTSVAIVHGQSEKGNSMIPFPRVGRSEARFFMEGKRNGNSLSPGLIPFPRIGRSGSDGPHEMKRQLIPFPRVGKRPYWRAPAEPYMFEYEDYMMDPANMPNMMTPPVMGSTGLGDLNSGVEENDNEKRSNNNGGMWFGPRLGKRRKRSIETDTSAERGHESLDTRTLLKILHNFNWAIVPIKERRNFTPRLGRSSDEVGAIHRRSQPYTPRLGRSREFVSGEQDEEEQSSRFSRSGSSTGETSKPTQASPPEDGSTGGALFSPRLGRDHIQPRLGRSGSGEDHD